MNNNIDPTEEYPKVEKMIFKFAHRTAERYPYPSEEEMYETALGVAHAAFMEACRWYNPKKGMSFRSTCYHVLYCKLKELVTRRTLDPLLFVELDDDLCGSYETLRFDVQEFTSTLGEEACEVVMMLLETPAELLALGPCTPKQLFKRVRDYMVTRGAKRQTKEQKEEKLEKFEWVEAEIRKAVCELTAA